MLNLPLLFKDMGREDVREQRRPEDEKGRRGDRMQTSPLKLTVLDVCSTLTLAGATKGMI